MATIYKLTDQNMQTHNGYQWVLGEWRETSGEGELCGPGFLHAYTDPLLAVLLNPIHADIDSPLLFVGEGEGVFLNDHGLKVGYNRMRLIEQIPLPTITTTQRIAFAILCAKEGYQKPSFVEWADKWLSGEDRSAWAAVAAGMAVRAASGAAARAAEAAAWAVYGAAWAAYGAASAAAGAAAGAAEADIDLIAIANKAMEY